MSEFKFAYPVCKQHMMCDTSQGGSLMECPTCFQKIIAPQAPAADAKFILTGTKLSDKKNSGRGYGLSATSASLEKTIPLKVFIIVLALSLATEAGIFLLYISHGIPGRPQTLPPPLQAGIANPEPTPEPAPEPAPQTNMATWTPDLNAVTIPDSAAAGKIHRQDFTVHRAVFWDGRLTLRTGVRGPFVFGVSIDFQRLQGESLAGKSINVATNAEQAAMVTLRWLEEGQQQKDNFTNRYAMRLEFGQLKGNNMPGKIYLCLPDEAHSFVAGNIDVEIYKPQPAPQPSSPQSLTPQRRRK